MAVDHQARKTFVAEVTADLIAREGLEATTMRTVAKAAGFSTSIITHYFRDKAALLELTYVTIANRRRERLLGLAEKAEDPLLDCGLALLPIGKAAHRDWLVYCAFLATGIAQERLAGIQAEWTAHSIQVFDDLLQGDGWPAGKQSLDAATRLVAVMTGLSVLNIMDPVGHDEEQIKRLAHQEIKQLRAPTQLTGAGNRQAKK